MVLEQSRVISLADIAHHEMLEKGFYPDFSSEEMQEISHLSAPAKPLPSFKDLRDYLWVSIDNDDSRDLDQLTYARQIQKDEYRVYVAIADVDSLVKKGSFIDKHAAHNTTSVYVPSKVFPMLPPKLSTDLTSLNEEADRCAVIAEMKVDLKGAFSLVDIYPAWVRNKAKLAYNGVSAWLEHKASLRSKNVPLPDLQKQLLLQNEIAQLIKRFRASQGALFFSIPEVEPVMMEGRAIGLEERIQNEAQELIENFMIAANVCVTEYMVGLNFPTLRRIVRTPKRWDRIVSIAKEYGETLPDEPNPKSLRDFLMKRYQADPVRFADLSLLIIKLIGRGEYYVALPDQCPIGHFDLALEEYSHTTAPNRRFPDLVIQRMLKSHFMKAPLPYSINELEEIAKNCTEKEDDANKVERRVQKSAAAMVMSSKIGQEFSAVVTGVNKNGTWVRILNPPIEGKLIRGYEGMDVGDQLKVKLVHTDVPNAFIDFVKQS